MAGPRLLPPMPTLCASLAGFHGSVGSRAWFRFQLLCWACLAAVAVHSARRWAGLWGLGRSHTVIVVGSCKTFGFLLMDVMALVALCLARQSHRRTAACKLGTASEAKLGEKARGLVLVGLCLAVVEGAHWGLWLYDLRHRRASLGLRYMITLAASFCVMATKPGLVCAFLPALQAREEAQGAMEELLGELRGGKLGWEALLVRYARLEERVSQLSGDVSLALGCLLLTIGLGAVLHGVSIWIWTERLSFTPSAAVNVNYALAVLYSFVFLETYFTFTGLGALHGQLVGAVAKQLPACREEDVWKLVQVYHYLRARPLHWSLQFGPGRVDVDELKGRYLSVAFVGNLAAKMAPRLRGRRGLGPALALRPPVACARVTTTNAALSLVRAVRVPGPDPQLPQQPGPQPFSKLTLLTLLYCCRKPRAVLPPTSRSLKPGAASPVRPPVAEAALTGAEGGHRDGCIGCRSAPRKAQ